MYTWLFSIKIQESTFLLQTKIRELSFVSSNTRQMFDLKNWSPWVGNNSSVVVCLTKWSTRSAGVLSHSYQQESAMSCHSYRGINCCHSFQQSCHSYQQESIVVILTNRGPWVVLSWISRRCKLNPDIKKFPCTREILLSISEFSDTCTHIE